MKKELDPLSRHSCNILPRPHHPPQSVTPKVGELVPGSMLGKDLSKSIVICVSCLKPIYIVYHDMKKEPVPIEGDRVPKLANEPCPRCGSNFCRYNEKTGAAQYLTNLGWV